jgi:hypothetical protein
MSKKSDTLRYTAKQITGKIAPGEDRIDWRKAHETKITDGAELTLAGTMPRLRPRRLSESKPAAGKYHDCLSLAL